MPDTGVADNCPLIQKSRLSENQKTLQYRFDRRLFGANFTLLPIVSSAVSEQRARNFGRLRRWREMQIHAAGQHSQSSKRVDSTFYLKLAARELLNDLHRERTKTLISMRR